MLVHREAVQAKARCNIPKRERQPKRVSARRRKDRHVERIVHIEAWVTKRLERK